MSRKSPKGNKRRDDLLNYIRKFHAREGFAPSISEMAEEMNTTKSNIYHHVLLMEREGLLTHNPRTARSWLVVD